MHTMLSLSCHCNWLHHANAVFIIMYYSLYSVTYVEVEVLLHLTMHLSWQQRLLKGEPLILVMNMLKEEEGNAILF